jgi:hypothetical protein
VAITTAAKQQLERKFDSLLQNRRFQKLALPILMMMAEKSGVDYKDKKVEVSCIVI